MKKLIWSDFATMLDEEEEEDDDDDHQWLFQFIYITTDVEKRKENKPMHSTRKPNE